MNQHEKEYIKLILEGELIGINHNIKLLKTESGIKPDNSLEYYQNRKIAIEKAINMFSDWKCENCSSTTFTQNSLFNARTCIDCGSVHTY